MQPLSVRHQVKAYLYRIQFDCVGCPVNCSFVPNAFVGVSNDELDSIMDLLDVADEQGDYAALAEFGKLVTEPHPVELAEVVRGDVLGNCVLHSWPDSIAELNGAESIIYQQAQEAILGGLVAVMMLDDDFVRAARSVFAQRQESVGDSNWFA